MSRLRCSLVFSISKPPLRCPPPYLVYARTYVSRNEATSNLGRQLERGLGKDTSPAAPGSVGPFPLGVQPLNLRSSREPPVKPWNQLTTGGKGIVLYFRALCIGAQADAFGYSVSNNSTGIESHSYSFRSYTIRSASLCPCHGTVREEFSYRTVR
jgi:hypothetical protein